jgi:hypothetical protein
MPPTSQRRNTAYINRPNWRFGWENFDLDGPAPRAFPDLRFISGLGRKLLPTRWSPVRSTWNAANSTRRGNEGQASCEDLYSLRKELCVLTVELSGAHADSCEWHFIPHASARTMC